VIGLKKENLCLEYDIWLINCPVLIRANFRCGSHPERGFHLSRYYTINEGQGDGGNIFAVMQRSASAELPWLIRGASLRHIMS
jgi:hypothetical protein